MRNFRTGFVCLLATLLVAFAAGCGQETVTIPGVVSVTPAQGAVGVAVNTAVTATFSMAMDPATITASTFTLAGPGGVAVAGAVSYNGVTATLMPAANLANGTTYTATVTSGAATHGGAGLVSNFVWSFSTIAAIIPPVPSVVSVTPLPFATNVLVNAAISATFSTAMNGGSISGTTFTLAAPGGVPVAGAVTLSASGLVATFVPTGGVLAYSITYTATITTGAMSAANVPLAGAYVWTFTTITPPPMVIATVPTDTATGVPVAQVLTATFNESMLCATLKSPATTFTVNGPGVAPVAGTVSCAGAIAIFTPAADLAFNTLYTATINTGAQDLAGTPMVTSKVWTFRTLPAPPLPPAVISTVPVNLAPNVPVNQTLSATFSEAMDPVTINSATFLLKKTGGAAVNGVIAYVPAGSVATFKPFANLAPSTNYTATITSGALDLNDSEGVVTYTRTFTTAAGPITIAPTVISTIPVTLPEDVNVSLNQAVSAVFSEAMNPATINSTTFMLTGPGVTPVSGLVAYAAIGDTLVFIPSSNLTADTTYTATITTGVQDLAGDPLAANYVWTFKTGAVVVAVPPELVSTVPVNAAINVPLNQAVSATFSEAMDPLTLTTTTFQLMQGGTLIPATITYDAINFIATLTPTNPLTASTTYTATVTNGATDLAGNPLGNTGAPNPWTFTTGAVVIPPPIILGPTISLFGSFGGGAGITNQGINTVVHGDIGTTGASTKITGFHDDTVMVAGIPQCVYTETPSDIGLVTGAIDTATPPPTVGCPNEGTAATFAIATQAALEAQTAYLTLQAIPLGITLATDELGNRVLAPGTYKSASFYQITTGPLTLDAQGDPNAFWVFQMGSYLTVGTPTAPESVILLHGAQAKNVYWAVGGLPGAVINYGGGGTMVGTIISQPGITISSPGVAAVTTINGRVLALNASTTMVNTVINVP
jgi:hypothetical protein